MKLLILGAAGRTGSLLVNQALAAGHTVTTFVRGEAENIVQIPYTTTIMGDARNISDLEKAFKGQDAVISTLGSSKPGDRVIADSTAALITIAKTEKVKRIIMMSSFLASKNFQPNPIVKFALRLMRSIVADVSSGEGQLRGSDLDYTIVYATRLTNEPLGPHYKVVSETEKVGAGDSISRADVAEFLLKQLNDKTYVRKSVLITNK